VEWGGKPVVWVENSTWQPTAPHFFNRINAQVNKVREGLKAAIVELTEGGQR